jgi:hypothetical protein
MICDETTIRETAWHVVRRVAILMRQISDTITGEVPVEGRWGSLDAMLRAAAGDSVKGGVVEALSTMKVEDIAPNRLTREDKDGAKHPHLENAFKDLAAHL